MTNRLHTMLGSMEDKVHQAKSQGTTHNVDSNLLSVSQKYSSSGKVLFVKSFRLVRILLALGAIVVTQASAWVLVSYFKVLRQSFLYVMGMVLSSELSCKWTGMV